MHRLWDKIGISLSFLCLIHCLALPILALLLPSLNFIHDEHDSTHLILGALIWPTALLAFIPAYRHHRKKSILLMALLGLALLSVSLLLHHWETPISIAGSLILVYAHYLNYRCNRCQKCHDHQQNESSTPHPLH